MVSRARFLAALNCAFLLCVFGCGDDGAGCGPAPQKQDDSGGGGAGGGGSLHGGGGGGDIIISDRKGNVPKPYQRPASKYEPEKSTATATAPSVAKSTAATSRRKPPKLGMARVLKRQVDGVEDRVEIACRVLVSSPDGECASAPNYAEVKERCCPNGTIERCKTAMSGVVLVGRGCDSSK